MKTSFIFLVSFVLLLAGCAALEDLTDGENFEIANAGFENWRQAPVQGGDVPEVGTNLAIIVRDWPEPEEGYTPKYIIYNERKSFPVEITNREDNKTVMNAKIIRSSSVMSKTSEEVNLSDRLVFTRPNGEVGFLKIEEWQDLGS
ncbi:MAG: hypothetical protein JXR26_10685 [Balneolaceae bacterium]|nr:hypothetical protein [Balneolaceae bacterium]